MAQTSPSGFRLTVSLVLSAIILAFGLWLIIPDRSADTTSTATTQTQTGEITYNGVEGTDALTLLKASHRVETQTSSFGEYVQSIDGVAADSTHFWGFYVNDKLADVGAGAYITKATDRITWKLDAIQ